MPGPQQNFALRDTIENSGSNYTASDLKPSAPLVPETSKSHALLFFSSPKLSNPPSRGSANLSRKGAKSKYCGFCRPRGVCRNYSAPPLECNANVFRRNFAPGQRSLNFTALSCITKLDFSFDFSQPRRSVNTTVSW